MTPGKYIAIAISDDGCGMSKEVMQRIFDPFYTTKRPGKGTGLGLSATYGTICDHHGAIEVKASRAKAPPSPFSCLCIKTP